MEDAYPITPMHGRTPRSAGARAFFARLTDAAKAVGSVAASASELLTDRELRRKGAGYIMSEASKGIQGIQKGIESSAEAVGRTAKNRFEVGSKSVQSVLKNIERQVSEFQRQQQLHDQEDELDHYRKLPVDIQIGEQVYEDMPQEMRSRLWYALLDQPELAHPFRPISGPKHVGSRSSSRMHSHGGGSDAHLSRGSSGAGPSSSGAGPSSSGAGPSSSTQGVQTGLAGSTGGMAAQERTGSEHEAAAEHGQQQQQQQEQEEGQQQEQEQEQAAPATADAADPLAAASPASEPPQFETHEGAHGGTEASSAAAACSAAAAVSGTAVSGGVATSSEAQALEAASAESAEGGEQQEAQRTLSSIPSSIPDIDDLLAQQPSGTVQQQQQQQQQQQPLAGPLGTQPAESSLQPSEPQPGESAAQAAEAADGPVHGSSRASSIGPEETSSTSHAAATAAGALELPGTVADTGAAAGAAVPSPSATQVLEAATQDEWQAMAAAAAAAKAAAAAAARSKHAELQPASPAEQHKASTTAAGDGSVSSDAPHAAGPGAASISSAAPGKAVKRVTLSTPFHGSNGSSSGSSEQPAFAVQHASSSGGTSSRHPGVTRVSDGGDTEWEVVSKDALPVLSTSGEVEALETVRSIVQSLSDRDELDRLRASKAALFQAMLDVPWLPGEGIPRTYDEQCPYALLLQMDSPGGSECVDEVIQRDIHRTFPEHPLFSEAGGQAGGQQRLYRLLRAYACRDAEVGYCQGMAFAAGVLLMYLPEEPAFRLFCRLMEPSGPNLRRLYLPGLDPLKAELSRFELLLATHLPLLHEHLLAAGLPAVLYASQWLMTVYAAPFPVHFAARLMDVMLLEGNDNVLPRVALSIMEAMAEELLALDDFEALITHLKVKPLQWKIHKYRQVVAAAIDSHVSDGELEAAAAAVAAEGVRLGRPPSFRGAALQRCTTAGGGSFHALAPLGELQGSGGDGEGGDRLGQWSGAGPCGVPRGDDAESAGAAAAAVAAGGGGQASRQQMQQGRLNLNPTISDGRSAQPLLDAEAELAVLQAAEMAELDAAFMDMMIEADLLLPGGGFDVSRDPSQSGEGDMSHSLAEEEQQQQQQQQQ